jgi:hypothetical protein
MEESEDSQIAFDLQQVQDRLANLESARRKVDEAEQKVRDLQSDLRHAKRKAMEARWNLAYWQRAIEDLNNGRGK